MGGTTKLATLALALVLATHLGWGCSSDTVFDGSSGSDDDDDDGGLPPAADYCQATCDIHGGCQNNGSSCELVDFGEYSERLCETRIDVGGDGVCGQSSEGWVCCVAVSQADCTKSTNCKHSGYCGFDADRGRCLPLSPEHCSSSEDCLEHGFGCNFCTVGAGNDCASAYAYACCQTDPCSTSPG